MPRRGSSKYKSKGLWFCVCLLIGFVLLPAPNAVEKLIRKPIETTYSVEDPEFRNSISQLLGAPLLEGNSLTQYINGDQIFPAMLAAIGQAKVSITYENFIWRSGKLSDLFIEALTERARAGVKNG